MSSAGDLPPIVAAALDRAARAGFERSCEPGFGRLLAALAAAVPPGGRICELGTGVGVGLAWIVHGLEGRDDACVVSVELDDPTAEIARSWQWPRWAEVRTADALELLSSEGAFDLIFADAPGGKWTGLDRTIAALAPGGVLVMDDMALVMEGEAASDDGRDEERRAKRSVRADVLGHPDLVAAELEAASGVLLGVRRSPAVDTRRSTA